MASGIYTYVIYISLEFMGDTIAGRALGYTVVALPFFMFGAEFFVLVKSEKMARLYIALSRTMDFDHVKYRISVTDGLTITVTGIYITFTVVYIGSMPTSSYADKIILLFIMGHYYIMLLIYTYSLMQVYTVLSKQLLDAIMQAVPPSCSHDPSMRESENKETHEDLSVSMASLNKLEKKICTVWTISIYCCFTLKRLVERSLPFCTYK